MTTFDTRNGHVTIDTATHKAVPKDAIVLDLSDAPDNGGQSVAHTLRDVTTLGGVRESRVLRWIAGQIEAQTKPARIPEPGLWGVVEATIAGQRMGFVRTAGDTWLAPRGGQFTWSELDDPTLVREGVES